MATYNDSYSPPRQPIPSSPISIVDIFFPGFTNISAAIQQLQASQTNGYAQMLCICGIAVFFGRYAYKHLKAFVETHFSSFHSKPPLALSDGQQGTPSTSPTLVKHMTCWSPGHPLSHLPTRHLHLLLASAREEEDSPTATPMTAGRNRSSSRLGKGPSSSGIKGTCLYTGACRVGIASSRKKRYLSPA
jgi:hypothetical protein